VNSERIYLDNAATTALRPEVADAMGAVLSTGGFNPSSLHAEGRRARAVLDEARDRIAALLGAKRTEIIFTASGTEADNQALFGVAHAAPRPAHLIVSAIEHHAVLAAAERLRAEGIDVTVLPVGSDGCVDPATLADALQPHTVLVSIMYANNEIGTVQPITKLARVAHDRGILFHTDAVQAPSWLPVDARELGADLLSLSAHKFGGPKGVGLLYARSGVALVPIVHGGGQEFGRRSGTENVAGAVGMACALELAAAERAESSRRVAGLRDRLEAGIRSVIADVRVNGADAPRLANNLNVSFAGIESAALLIGLDLSGVAVSAGSACTSGVLEPSHVLAALALEPHWQTGAIRFSLGMATTSAEVDRVLAVLPGLVSELRAPAPAA
jgi:cysteine desulfurase